MKVQGTGETSPRQEGCPSKPSGPHRGSCTLHTRSSPTPSAQGALGAASEVALVLCPSPGPQKARSPVPSQPHTHFLRGPPGVRNSSEPQGKEACWERVWPGADLSLPQPSTALPLDEKVPWPLKALGSANMHMPLGSTKTGLRSSHN